MPRDTFTHCKCGHPWDDLDPSERFAPENHLLRGHAKHGCYATPGGPDSPYCSCARTPPSLQERALLCLGDEEHC